MGRYRYPFVIAGVALAVWLVWRLGPGNVWAQLAGGYWPAFAGVVGAYALQQSLGTFALWLLGTKEHGAGWKSTSFLRLARIRYVGEVLNYSMPTGQVAGEPYKYFVLTRTESRREAFQSLMTAKFMHISGIGPFAAVILFGAASTGLFGPGFSVPLYALGAFTVAVTCGAWALILWQGIGRTLTGAFYRIRRRVPRWLRWVRRFLETDRAVAMKVRRAGAARTLAAWACYIGMWWAAALEWLAISQVLGIGWDSLGLIGGGAFECTTLIVGIIPVPAGLGTQEAGKVAMAAALGLVPASGMAMSLVRRAREILMVLLALALGMLDAVRNQVNNEVLR